VKKSYLFGKIVRFTVLTMTVLALAACACFPSPGKIRTDAIASADRNIPPDTSQVLLVVDDSFLFWTSRKVYALERDDSAWREARAPMNAVVGRNGFAPPGEKREGDGRTPSGLYRLGTVFGYAESAATKMPYRRAGADDLWVDDIDAADYNRWVKQSETRAASFEKMRRDDDLYKYGVVIEYNTDPVVKGYGSAIFMHVWAGAGSTTAGCVAVSEEDILSILAWLNPAAKPVILINPDPIP